MMKRVLITGISGQDGAYLAKLLLDKSYEVYGALRRSSSDNMWRLRELGIQNEVRLVHMDLLEMTNILRTLDKVKPDEIYNLAAQSFVGISFEQPLYTADVDALGTIRLLEALRSQNCKARFYQASTSEMFGKVQEIPQNERTKFYPRSPYAVAKLFAHWSTINYRESYDMYASSGILFNHESPLRGSEFVTRKITEALAKIKYGKQAVLELGNIESKRDWGYAGDFVLGMWMMLQQESADDYVLATGKTHSVQEFIDKAAEVAGFHLVWDGEGSRAKAYDRKTKRVIVQVNPEFYRPAEVDLLIGDPTKARQKLGWTPKMTFDELVQLMMQADLNRIKI